MRTSEERVNHSRCKDEYERRLVDNVRDHGVHILHIFDESGEKSEFSYTVGLWHTHRHPEILIYGLKKNLRHTLLNNLNCLIGNNRVFLDGMNAKDVIDGYTCFFQEIPKTHYREHLGRCWWFYEGSDFPAVQMIWPSVQGIYPWDEDADDYLRWTEPILTQKPSLIQ